MKKSINFFGLLLFVGGVFAQTPNWIINPNEYQYNMTITAIAEINCNELLDSNNQIAAFIGNSLHGTAYTSVSVNGSLQANLVIYSNTVDGDTITFKIYNNAIDSIYSSVDTVFFQSDKVMGNPSSPYGIKNNNQPENLLFTGGNVDENAVVGTVAGSFSTSDIDSNQLFTYSFTSGTGDSNNTSFIIVGDELLINEIPDYETRRQYGVRILSNDDQGCGISKDFLIHVQDKNDLPSLILMSDTSFDENLSIGSLVASLDVVDEDSSSYHYSFVSGTGDEDNPSFNIMDNQLRTNEALDYEAQSIYRLRIQVSDSSGGVFQQMFICTINDLNEAPIILDQIFTVSENENIGYEVDTAIYSDVDINQIHKFNVIDESPFPFRIDSNTGIINLTKELDYEKQSEYDFYLEVSDNGNPRLTDTAYIIIKVLDVIEQELPVANFISPNGDGKNDVWEIMNVELYSNYQLNIYSVSGAIVFSRASNYNNDFDGTTNGQELEEGVYYYLLKSADGVKVYKGVINLIR